MDAVLDREHLIALIQRYADILNSLLRVDSIYLFGSYARGMADPESDIDLLVVSPDFGDDPVENQLLLRRARRSLDYRIEPHLVCSGELGQSVLFTIARDEMQRII